MDGKPPDRASLKIIVVALLLTFCVSRVAGQSFTVYPFPHGPGPIAPRSATDFWVGCVDGIDIVSLQGADLSHFVIPKPVSIAPLGQGDVLVAPWIGTMSAGGVWRSLSWNSIAEGGALLGPDGLIWYQGANTAGNVALVRMTLDFVEISSWTTPALTLLRLDSYGNVWAAEVSRLHRYSPSGENLVVQLQELADPTAMAEGPDGNLWFTEFFPQGPDNRPGPGRIGRVTPAGVLTEFALPFGAGPWDIVLGPDGNLWFSEWGGAIGRIDMNGAITHFPLPPPAFIPHRLMVGPDRALWITSDMSETLTRMAFPASSAQLFTVEPCRAFDSRDASFTGAGAFQAGEQRVVAITGRCGVPASAVSVAGNVVAVQGSAAGAVRVASSAFDTSTDVPFRAGQTRSRSGTLVLGGDGSGRLWVTNDSPGVVDVVIDVTGYFASP